MLRDAGLAQHLAYALQLALGGVFLAACALKLRRPGAFVRTVADYQVLPRSAALETVAAAGIMVTEAALALSFLTGWLLEAGVVLAAATLLAFVAGVAINLRRGRTISCGCFGADTERISGHTLVRLGLLLAAVVALGGLVALTAARAVTAGAVLDEPAYLAETGGIAVVLGLVALWSLNARSVAAVATSLRGEPLT